MKSTHNYSMSKDISNDELGCFINPINISLKVDRDSMYSVFNRANEVDEEIKKFYKGVFELLPSLDDAHVNNFINHYGTISYVAHTSGYDFRYEPIEFINSLFKYLSLDYEIPFVNLDNGYGMNYLKDYVRAYIADFKRDDSKKNDPNYSLKNDVLDELNDNLDLIVNMYYRDLDRLINDHVIAKTMLLYLAFESLDKYEKTHEDKYLVFPYEYYHYVSHMRNSRFPHKVMFNGTRQWFDEFRTKYESDCDPRLYIDDQPYILDDNEVLLAWDILKPGMVEREIRDVVQVARSSPNVDYDKYMQLFQKKMNYYMNSPFIKYIKGKYGLLGYVGFAYKNEYLIFDKFHNSDTLDEKKRTILTHAEAIYALPSDRFSVISDKQRIIAAKKADSRIKKINHTPNDSYFGKLDGIIQGPNVSTSTLDKAIEVEKKRMLIRNKHI